MKAWQLTRYGEPQDVLELADVPRPAPGPGQLLVRVLAAAANFPDVLLCRGSYQVRPPLPFSPGVELCGEVVQTGPEVTRFAAGDRVIGGTALPHGAFAEYALMDAPAALPAPAALDDAEAAPFYVTYETCWVGLHRRARLRDGNFLVLPHPEVHDYYVQRATDTDRWLRGMSRLQQRIEQAAEATEETA